MNKDLVAIPKDIKIILPDDWDYGISVKYHINLFKQVREKGAEAIIGLRIAHQILTEDSNKKKNRKYPDKTFEIYCNDIETNKQTCYNWFRKYFPVYYKEHIYRAEVKKLTSPLPEGEYDIIYADPPWKYDFSETQSREIENNYPTMTVEEICNLEIPTSENAVLFLWATAPKIREALEIMKAWGFEYKTHSIWDKEIIGMGYWFRGQHELLLVGTKGDFSPPTEGLRESSVYSEKRMGHSKKPDYYYELIEKYFPDSEYLELFARKKHNDKWTVWGNERI
jgi:N6-adenosine-specific RNA methylase IME4